MPKWIFKAVLMTLVGANAWLFMGLEASAEVPQNYTDTCGCVYGGGGGGPSGPGTPTCFSMDGNDCNEDSDCEECAEM